MKIAHEKRILPIPTETKFPYKWKAELRLLEKEDDVCLPDLFEAIEDWKDFVFHQNNTVIGLLRDEYGVWRCGMISYIYEEENIMKIPLFSTSLHFRKQGLGRLFVSYVQAQLHSDARIIALAMDDPNAITFWERLGFKKIDLTCQSNFDVKAVLTEEEIKELTPMELKKDLKFDNLISSWNQPEYRDILKRYANTEEEKKLLKDFMKRKEEGKVTALFDLENEIASDGEGEEYDPEDEEFDESEESVDEEKE